MSGTASPGKFTTWWWSVVQYFQPLLLVDHQDLNDAMDNAFDMKAVIQLLSKETTDS